MTERRELPAFEAKHGRIRGLCRECGKKVKPPRKSWCSDECVLKHRMRSDPGYQRMAVFNRDRGICQACGRDCVALRAELQPLLAFHGAVVTLLGNYHANGSLDGLLAPRYSSEQIAKVDHACQVVLDLGLLLHVGRRDSFWDMDHHRPLWAGGKNELSNLRTLCIPCHREATKAGAELRAKRRRNE